jgi:hypothetical protein
MAEKQMVEVRRIIARAVCGARFELDPHYVCDDSCLVIADRVIAELGAWMHLPRLVADSEDDLPVRARRPRGHSLAPSAPGRSPQA